jgi:hypothetical protein
MNCATTPQSFIRTMCVKKHLENISSNWMNGWDGFILNGFSRSYVSMHTMEWQRDLVSNGDRNKLLRGSNAY